MNAETIKGKTLSYILMKPNRYRAGTVYPLVILLHDFGESMYDLVGIASGMDDRGYIYACPNAPYGVKSLWGLNGYSWLAERERVEPAAAGTPALEELLDGFVAEAREQVGDEEGNTLLTGFGDGGQVALGYGLLRPQAFRGIACINGALDDLESIGHRLPKSPAQSVFIAQTSADEDLRTRARATKELLASAKYPLVYNEYAAAAAYSPPAANVAESEEEEYSMPSAPPHPELRDMVAWVKETLPPYTR